MYDVTAIILAAGRGSRMLNLTEDKPKCLVLLDGKTLFEWQLTALKEAGIKEIILVTGYRSESFIDKGFKSFHNIDWAKTNIVESLCCAHEILSTKNTLISYSDIIYHKTVVEALLKSPHEIAITYDILWRQLWEKRFNSPLDDAETFILTDNKLVEIGKKTTDIEDIQGQYMGLLKCTPKGFSSISEIFLSIPKDKRKQMDMTTLLQKLIDAHIFIDPVSIKGRWCEVDSEEDLVLYESILKKGSYWTHDWRDTFL